MRNSDNSKWLVLLYSTKLGRFYHADSQELCALDQARETSEYLGGCRTQSVGSFAPMAMHSAVPGETGNLDFYVKLSCLENTEMGQAKFLCAGSNPWAVGRQLLGEGLAQGLVHSGLRYSITAESRQRKTCCLARISFSLVPAAPLSIWWLQKRQFPSHSCTRSCEMEPGRPSLQPGWKECTLFSEIIHCWPESPKAINAKYWSFQKAFRAWLPTAEVMLIY